MTDTGATVSAAPVKAPSFWEDLIDVFIQPAAVFRRRQSKSVWPPLLFVAIALALIGYFTFPALVPLLDADLKRSFAQAMAKNPQMTQAMADTMRDRSETFGRYTVGIVVLIGVPVLGLLAWVVGKLFGSRQTVQAAIGVAAWSYMPRVLEAVVNAVQALVMDTTNLPSVQSITLSPARFLNPDTANPMLYQLSTRLNLFTIWVTILLAVGLCVTGRVSKGRATAFGIVMWILGSLWALRTGYMAM